MIHEEEKVFVDWQLIKKLSPYISPYKIYIFASLFILVASKAIEAAVPVLIGRLSQDILDREMPLNSYTDKFIVILTLLVLAYLLECVNVWLRGSVGRRATVALRSSVYSHIQQLPISYFDKNPVGKLMTRTLHDVDQIHQMLAESFVPLVGNFLLFIGIFIGIFYVNWQVALILAIFFPFIFWLTNHFRIEQRRCYDKIRQIVSAMNAFVQENLMGILIIRNFSLEKQEKKIFEEMNEAQRDAYLKSIQNFSFFIAGIEFFQNMTLIAAFVILAGYMAPAAGFQAGAFFTFSLYSLMIFRPLIDLAERYNILQAAMAGASRIFSLLSVHTEKNSGTLHLSDIHTIEFKDVWFSYEKDHPVLKGISFAMKKGESIAIVGITGSGKTTVMNLLLRFYEAQKGEIFINGQNIKSYTLDSLRSCFSMVLQDPILFSGTIAENIAFFQPLGRKTIEAAAGYVNLSEFIKNLDQPLGERGQGLSAGEMQLVSLARAAAFNRSMFILDEATANIDTITEKAIQDALGKILKERTALVIAHRLSTIRNVSRIIVIAEGKVLESGTHDELISKKGLYEKLYFLQF